MKRKTWQLLMTAVVALILVVPAEAQRGRRGGGKRGGGGGRRGGANKKAAAAKKAAKAQKKAEAAAKKQLQQKTQKLKTWVQQEKVKAQARQKALKEQAKSQLPDASEMGPVFRSHCASCHTIPDPGHPTDATWLASLGTTQCRDLTPELREGLEAYLREAAQFRPHAVTAYAEPAAGQASITSNIEGELMLRSDKGTAFRLKWGPGQAGEKRVVLPGRYELTGYRMSRGTWTVSASGGSRIVTVQPDNNLPVKLPQALRLELTTGSTMGRGKPNGAGLAFTLRDAHGQALSIYKEGKRVRIPFQVETKAGAAQHGVMTYTREGRAEAGIQIPLGQPAFARVDLPHDFPWPLEGAPRIPLPPAR